MHLDPDPALPLAQLERAGPSGKPKVPVVTTRAPGQLALAAHEKATPTAFGECVIGSDIQLELNHARLRS